MSEWGVNLWFQLSLLQTHLTFGKEFTEAVEMKQVGEYNNDGYWQKSNCTDKMLHAKLWANVSCYEQKKTNLQ